MKKHLGIRNTVITGKPGRGDFSRVKSYPCLGPSGREGAAWGDNGRQQTVGLPPRCS